MHATVPVRFGRGRLDSLGNKGLAAYLIAAEPGMRAYVNVTEAGSRRAIATPSARLNPIDSESAYPEEAGYNA